MTKATTERAWSSLLERLPEIRLRQLAPKQSRADLQADLVPHTISAFARQSSQDMQDSTFLSNHNYFILLLAFNGHGQYELDDKTYSIGPGTAFLTFPFQVHCYSDLSDDLSWLYFRFECDCETKLKSLRHSPRNITDELVAASTALLDELTSPESWRSAAKTSLATVDLLQALNNAPGKGGLKRESKDKDKLKQRVQKYVLANMAEPVQVDDIADSLSISTSYLRSLFKRYYGISVGKFVLKLKITHACQLILNTSMQMQEVADACGFGSAFSFSRAFKRMMCLTPREYRDWFHAK